MRGGADCAGDTCTAGKGTLKEKDALESELEEIGGRRNGIQEELASLDGRIGELETEASRAGELLRQHEITNRVMEADTQKISEVKKMSVEEAATIMNIAEQEEEEKYGKTTISFAKRDADEAAQILAGASEAEE